MKKQFTLLCFFFLIFSISNAQVIPADRFTDWSGAGYPDSIPEPTLILDVTTFGAVGDGVTDNFSAVNSAINALNGAQGVIYFPAGDYLISTTLNLPF